MDITVNLFKPNMNMFDAIICDPPYGYRAGARESGHKPSGLEKKLLREAKRAAKAEAQNNEETVEEENVDEEDEQHVPSFVNLNLLIFCLTLARRKSHTVQRLTKWLKDCLSLQTRFLKLEADWSISIHLAKKISKFYLEIFPQNFQNFSI